MTFRYSNGSNAANAGYYVLIANGGNTDLRAWNGASLATSPTVATFAGLSALNTPFLIYSDTGDAPAVAATINGSGLLTLTRNAAFDGTVRVTATESDGAQAASQSFNFTVTNAPPSLPGISNVTVTGGATATLTVTMLRQKSLRLLPR